VPHWSVLDAVAKMGFTDKALVKIASFLSGRTQQVKVGSSSSIPAPVILQGSVLGPTLYIIAIDSLLCSIKLPFQAFADDLNSLLTSDVIVHSTYKTVLV
jgi:hypothetical protein